MLKRESVDEKRYFLKRKNEAARRQNKNQKPNQAKPSQTKPSQAEPSQAKTSQAKPRQARTSQAKPSQAKPSEKTSFCFGASPLHIFFKVLIFIYDVAFFIFFRNKFNFQKKCKTRFRRWKTSLFKRKYEEAKRQNRNQKPSQAKPSQAKPDQNGEQ